jgi:hypothetical protein
MHDLHSIFCFVMIVGGFKSLSGGLQAAICQTSVRAIHRDGYKTLKEGDQVSFDIIQGEKGQQADHVICCSSKQGTGSSPDEATDQ